MFILQCVREKNCNPTSTMVKQLHLSQFKQNLQEIMLNNLTITVQNFVSKFWKLTKLFIVEFLAVKITVSNVMSKKMET